jgi:hypothetical protein
MTKFCINCGKQLSFFKSLFGSICDDCNQKKTTDVLKNTKDTTSQLETTNTNSKIGGEIAYFGLQNWWVKDLTPQERNTILSLYQPIGLSKNSLIEGNISYSGQTATAFLTGLLSWFKKPEYQQISSKIIKQIDALSMKKGSVMDRHFFLTTKIQIHYRNRDTEESALPAAIEACKELISISSSAKRAFLRDYPNSPLPSHVGYNQLCIILEKQKNYDEVIRLAKNAKEQGWMGDWDKRIDCCIKKQNGL